MTTGWEAVDADAVMVSDYLSWLSDVRRRQPATVAAYGSALRQWVQWLYGRGVVLGTATLTDVEEFQNRPRQKRGRGGNGEPATQRREIVTLRGFYAWGLVRGHFKADPTMEAFAPAQPKRQPRPIPDAVWTKAWALDMPDPLRAAMGLGFFCGLRRAEVVSLTVDQLTDARIVNFVRKGGGEDTLSWRTMVEVYAQHLGHLGHEQFITSLGAVRRRNSHVTPFQDPAWFNRAINGLGVDFTPHNLRHSCATNLIRAGVPLPIVSRMMNHTSITTTMLYVKAGGDELKDWLKQQP